MGSPRQHVQPPRDRCSPTVLRLACFQRSGGHLTSGTEEIAHHAQPWRRRFALAAIVLVGAACGDDEPTGPIPDVAGTYTGSFIVQFLLNSQAMQGRLLVIVEQSGESVTLTGEIEASGGTASIPAVTGTLDATGFLELTGGGFSASVNEEFCGPTRTLSSTVRFFGRSAEVSEHADTDFCGRVILSGSLTRQ